MAKTFKLKEGDNARTIRIKVVSGPQPDSAVLVLSSSITRVRAEFPLEYDTDGSWCYRFQNADFVLLFAGLNRNLSYKAEMYATVGGKSGTFPTEGTLTVLLFKRL